MAEPQRHSAPEGAPPRLLRDDSAATLLERYKLYVETTEKLADRRANMHTLLMAVNSLLVTVYSAVGGKHPEAMARAVNWRWLAPIPITGILISLSWLMLIRSYRRLSSAKFSVIKQMELRLPIQSFYLEWQEVKSKTRGKYVTLHCNRVIHPTRVRGTLHLACD